MVPRRAPEDEARHDEDPEEHYGIMTAGRKPKAAYHAVQEMFLEQGYLETRLVPVSVMVMLTLAAIGILYMGSLKRKKEEEARAYSKLRG